MSIFPWSRPDDDSLRSQVAELCRVVQEQGRALEEASARLDEQIQLLWLAHPSWLREEIDRAQASEWMVVPTREAIVFHRTDSDDRFTVPVPLPDGATEVRRLRGELMVRIRAYEQAA